MEFNSVHVDLDMGIWMVAGLFGLSLLVLLIQGAREWRKHINFTYLQPPVREAGTILRKESEFIPTKKIHGNHEQPNGVYEGRHYNWVVVGIQERMVHIRVISQATFTDLNVGQRIPVISRKGKWWGIVYDDV